MTKKNLFFFLILFLTSCSAPGTALLGPTFTGVKTGSALQTSLSYGSGKMMAFARESYDFTKNKVNESINEIKEMPVLLSLMTHKIEISESSLKEISSKIKGFVEL